MCVLNDGNQLTTDATAGSVTLNNLGWTHGLGFCATSCRTDPDCSGEGVEGICRLSQDSGGNLKLTITGGGNLCAPTCKQQACPAGLTCTGSLFSCGNTTDPLLCAPCGDSPVVQAETPDCKPGQLTCVDDQVSVCDCAGSWSRSACADTCSAGLCSPHLTSIVTGGQYFCGTRQNGSVSCWGKNSFGESSPPAGKLVSVTASDSTTCGLTPAGQVQCWGERPVTLAGDFKQIVRVGSGLCGVLQDGTLACAAALASDKAPPPPAGTFVELVAGYDTACARAEDGTVACWGATAMRATFTPPTGSYTAIFGGSALSEWFCGTRADQSVNCWGDQSNLMQPPAGQYASVALSSYYACAVSIDGSISCWQGPRASSGLGLPLQPPAGTSFTQIAAGDFAACALTTDNRVICWGKGSPPGENVPPFD